MIAGLQGNDTIKGLDGNDQICGGSGKDTLIGGRGKDRLDGGGGHDRLDGGRGTDTCKGGGEADTASGAKRSARFLRGKPGPRRVIGDVLGYAHAFERGAVRLSSIVRPEFVKKSSRAKGGRVPPDRRNRSVY